jgi:hypothetical protein
MLADSLDYCQIRRREERHDTEEYLIIGEYRAHGGWGNIDLSRFATLPTVPTPLAGHCCRVDAGYRLSR